MKLAIMQPYLFPYIGYFQLIHAVDGFVIHDDVQYIKGGWINRNRILINNKEAWLTLPVSKDSFHLKINERYFAESFNDNKFKLIRQIAGAYQKAPSFNPVINLIRNILDCNERNLALFITNQLKMICNYIGINIPFYISSKLKKNDNLRGQVRVIEIIKVIGAGHYINPFGGAELYSKEEFYNNGIQLNFLKSRDVKYHRFNIESVPNLSIIDVLMFNSKEKVKELMAEYELI